MGQVLTLMNILATNGQTIPAEVHTARVCIEVWFNAVRLEVCLHLTCNRVEGALVIILQVVGSLVEALVAVYKGALDIPSDSRSLHNIGQRNRQIGTTYPSLRVLRVETWTTIHTLNRYIATKVVGCTHTLQRVVEAELTILERTECQTISELVEDITNQELEVLITPLDILRRKVEFVSIHIGVVAHQCWQEGVYLYACREAATRVVNLEIVVRAEVVLGTLNLLVGRVVDRRRFDATRYLTIAKHLLRRYGSREG